MSYTADTPGNHKFITQFGELVLYISEYDYKS